MRELSESLSLSLVLMRKVMVIRSILLAHRRKNQIVLLALTIDYNMLCRA
jgi:hypothetical protein